MKLYYWVARCMDDHDCYSCIGKTKAEVRGLMHQFSFDRFEEPHRRVVEYRDGFDLFMKLTGEDGGRSNAGRPTKRGD